LGACVVWFLIPSFLVQAHPLKEIHVGGGSCIPGTTGETANACGGPERGQCTKKKICECLDHWTGPYCLAHNGFNAIEYDLPDKITDLGFYAPAVSPLALIVGFGILACIFLVTMNWRERLDGYKPIPDTMQWRERLEEFKPISRTPSLNYMSMSS
jgi:hypothetical protein